MRSLSSSPGMIAGMIAGLMATGALAQGGGAAIPLDRPELTGTIAGRVCHDLDGDGQCEDSEPGVPSARVVLETGQVALTDTEGRYHVTGLDARAPIVGSDDTLWLSPGRHRVAVDMRGFGPGAHAVPAGATVELPMAGITVQDFAIQEPGRTAAPVSSAYGERPPQGLIQGDRIRFLVTGKARPGDRVRVDGELAELDPSGRYRSWKWLSPGSTTVTIQAEATDGTVSVSTEQVDVVQRAGSVLVIPRALQPVAQVELPSSSQGEAAAGEGRVRVRGKPGTRVQGPQGEVVIGPEGEAQVPVALKPGRNAVPLTIAAQGEAPRQVPLEVAAAAKPFAVGLLDLEATYGLNGPAGTRGFRLFGRGAAHAEYRLGDWELSGELDLRDDDATQIASHPGLLISPRYPDRLEQVLDPELYPMTLGDLGTTLTPNAPQGRLRVEAKNPTFGAIGFGTFRGVIEDGEIGRFQREIFGPYLALRAPISDAVKLGVEGFFSPGTVDPTRAVVTVPAHDELAATGGSLFYLGDGGVATGSEELRVVIRDGLTQLPLAEKHLVRGRDYEIDYLSGRVLLAEPLSFVAGRAVLQSDPLVSSPEPVLVADYEKVVLTGDARQTLGGEVKADLGPVHLSAGGARETSASSSYSLLRARAHGALGPVAVELEGAMSWGHVLDPGDFGVSEDGGLFFDRNAPNPNASGDAVVVRVKGPGLSPDGHVDASFRWRSAGFSDRSHDDQVDFRQLSLRAEQPIGPVVLGIIADDHTGADPRDPLGAIPYSSRTLGLSIGVKHTRWEARAEVKDAQLTAAPDLSNGTELTGARSSAGVFARYRLLPQLDLVASHQQTFSVRGEGLGAVDTTFTTVGAHYLPNESTSIGARVGYGPTFGPLAWLEGEVQRGQDAFYGTYSVDTDGPDVGRARAISGARTSLGDGSAVFVEDVASHDATELRLSRAVGFSTAVGDALRLTARYERGVRDPLGIPSSELADAGGVTASWITQRVRLFARAELRTEHGTPLLQPNTVVHLVQRVASLGAEVNVTDALVGTLRANYSDTKDAGVLTQKLLEGTASLAYRFTAGLVVLRYSITDELLPPSRGVFGEQSLQVLSLLPAFHIGSRFSLSAGANAGWSSEQGTRALVLSGSLRPAVRIIGGLEVAAEVARRSLDVDNQGLTALRGEIGYVADDRFRVAVGYTALGYSGLGLSSGPEATQDRVYLRAELAY